MKIEKLSAKWVPKQDRILLGILTNENSEYRFWLTRNTVKELFMTEFAKVARTNVDNRAQKKPLSKPNNEGRRFPLGEEGLLVQLAPMDKVANGVALRFGLDNKKNFRMVIPNKMLDRLMSSIDGLQRKAGWELSVDNLDAILFDVADKATIH